MCRVSCKNLYYYIITSYAALKRIVYCVHCVCAHGNGDACALCCVCSVMRDT